MEDTSGTFRSLGSALTKEVKISALENTLSLLITEKSKANSSFGICPKIVEYIRDETIYYCKNCANVSTFIPEFTFEYASMLSSIYGFNVPKKDIWGYWWIRTDFISRILFVEALIKELKK